MAPNVSSHISFYRRSVLTLRTRIWFFATVIIDMSFEIGQVSTLIRALETFKLFLSCMSSYVSVHRVAVACLIRAIETNVYVITFMRK